MSMWLYQMNQKLWEPQRYRVEIWEGERWSWSVCRAVGAVEEPPRPGDTVVFFYAPAGGHDPGFYGWAVITEWLPEHDEMYFRPVGGWPSHATSNRDSYNGCPVLALLWLGRAVQHPLRHRPSRTALASPASNSSDSSHPIHASVMLCP